MKNWKQATLLTFVLCFIHIQAQAAATLSSVRAFKAGEPSGFETGGEAGNITQGRDGFLYGTAPHFGAYGVGGAYKLAPNGSGFRVLHSFVRNSVGLSPEGADPVGGLTLGVDGNFYGTAQFGGTKGLGTVFKMTPAGIVTVLHHFGTLPIDGSRPVAAPIQGRDGNLYGTTYYSFKNGLGGLNAGAIYKVSPTGTGYQIIHNFKGTDGALPATPLVLGRDGNLYGTTRIGGANGNGVVFKIAPSGKPFKVLYNFNNVGTNLFGFNPNSLIQGTDGNFYGTTAGGGKGKPFGAGTIFKLTPGGILTTLHNFDSQSDRAPVGLVQASNGLFYGVTQRGGTFDTGVMFSINSAKTYTKLADFVGAAGIVPTTKPMLHTNGKIYGITSAGSLGFGAVYRLDFGAPEFVKALPEVGKVGSTIGLLGNLAGRTGIKFNGVNASKVTNATTTFLNAAVPAGASTGFITVTKPTTSLKTLNPFGVLP